MKSEFLSELDARYIGEKDEELWELLVPFVYKSEVAGITITVPAGFNTDFASVPRVPLAYWLTGGRAKKAAVVHDYLCVEKIVSREMADKVFLEAAELQGVPQWRRDIMWTAVRAYAVFSGKDSESEQKPIKPEDTYFG